MISSVKRLALAGILALGVVLADPKNGVGGEVYVPFLPPNSVRLHNIPPIYRRWWADVEHCSGQMAPIDGVTFYVTLTDSNGFWYNRNTHIGYIGYAGIPGVILIASPWLYTERDVKHEMLHKIASPRNHDLTYFMGKCKSEVVCNNFCVETSAGDYD